MSQTLPERRSTTEPQRWEPLSELEQMTQRMRRMLDQTFGGFGLQSPLITEGAGWAPLVDIEEQARRTGRFEYRVRLPEQVDSSKIEASLEQGVLTVRVPKSERQQRQKIEIKSK